MAQNNRRDQEWLMAGAALLLVFLAGRFTAPATTTAPLLSERGGALPFAAQPGPSTPAMQPAALPAEPAPRTTTSSDKPAHQPARAADLQPDPGIADDTPPDVYYRNCSAVRAAGAAPIRVGEPGYAPHLDRDGDGVACE